MHVICMIDRKALKERYINSYKHHRNKDMHDYRDSKGLVDRYINLYIHQGNKDMHEYIDSKGLKVWFLRSKSSGSFK